MPQQPNPKFRHELFPTRGGAGSSSHHRRRHDVFISFKGSDVRNRFAAHLRAAFRGEGVTSFADDDSRDFPRGENLMEAIPRAIQRSRFHVVVLSPNYASSEWCLDELVAIMMRCCSSSSSTVGCRSHVAIPIFYHLSPEEMVSRWYKEDLDRHKRRHTYERVDGWLQALPWIAHISGWVVPASGSQSEAQLVERIAKIMKRKVRELACFNEANIIVWGRPKEQHIVTA